MFDLSDAEARLIFAGKELLLKEGFLYECKLPERKDRREGEIIRTSYTAYQVEGSFLAPIPEGG